MKIVTDSAADLPLAELRAYGIVEAPLSIQFPEGELSSSDLTPDQFYERLVAMRPAIPTTAQPSGGMFGELYKKLLADGERILSIHISSGLSGTPNAARLGAELAAAEDRVTVWDTMTLSGGQRFQVLAAALAARAGWTLEQIEARLGELRAHTETIFTLDTLEYLARGGRIGRVQKALQSIAGHLHQIYGETPVWIAVMHGRFAEEAEALAAELGKVLQIAKIETLRVSPVLGVHTGPGVVGAAVAPISLFKDLL